MARREGDEHSAHGDDALGEDGVTEPAQAPVGGGDDEGFDLITSPLRRVRFGRAFVLAGPLGLAIALVLSLWVSTMHVRHSLLVQAETTWRAGDRLALRVQIVAERGGPIADTVITPTLEQGGARHPLPPLAITARGTAGEGSFEVPSTFVPGAAVLELDVRADGVDPIHERIDAQVVRVRAPILPTPVVSGSTLQYADDSDAQLEQWPIVLRASGRLLAGFDNELFVRVTDAHGKPFVGAVEVRLLDGELMGLVGAAKQPPALFIGSTDTLGLVRLFGPLGSDVIRIEVRARPPGAAEQVRRLRLVSFAGGVDIEVSPDIVRPGDAIEVKAWGLSAKLPILVDVHGGDGAFVDVMHPPVVGREPPRPWIAPPGSEGIAQLEAHNHVTAPGESTAFARVLVSDVDPGAPVGLSPLLAAYRATLEERHIEVGYDAVLERAYLDAIANASLTPSEVASARHYLLATLPAAIHGPPVALVTRERLETELGVVRGRWRIAMRVFLLGGGALFLGVMAVGMVRSHRRAAALTLAELRRDHDPADLRGLAEVESQVIAASRAGIARGMAVIAIMVGGIALTMFILESLVWVF
ncbi:MAG: hypothetical protein IAG13_28775 [Deltaproteobacteria bacterium]|nr:hypothetical protein [Nannocystaceae bacterium]